MIFFDAGGTLVLQDHGEAARRLGIEIEDDTAFEAHYRAMFEFSSMKRRGSEATWVWWQERYYGIVGHPEPAAAGPALDNGRGLWSFAIPGVREAIQAISQAGIRVAVISNSDGSVTESLGRAGFGDLFETIVDSAVVGTAKPDPAIFRLACEAVDVDASECWYVGDSEYHDVDGAEGAGFAAAWLVDPLRLSTVDRKVASVADLPRLML
jgi:HAD superfamily hydrolase (TIGR01662 family)